MLNLNRRPHEAVVIVCPDGTELEVILVSVRGNQVKLGFNAPIAYRVNRYEVHHRDRRAARGEALEGQEEPRGPHWVDYRLREDNAE